MRGMSPHWNANVVSGATTMFPGTGERTTKELTSLAPPVSHQQSRSTQCDLVDAPCALLYQLMWTSEGEFDASGPTALEIAPRRSRPPWTPNVSVPRKLSQLMDDLPETSVASSSRSADENERTVSWHEIASLEYFPLTPTLRFLN